MKRETYTLPMYIDKSDYEMYKNYCKGREEWLAISDADEHTTPEGSYYKITFTIECRGFGTGRKVNNDQWIFLKIIFELGEALGKHHRGTSGLF